VTTTHADRRSPALLRRLSTVLAAGLALVLGFPAAAHAGVGATPDNTAQVQGGVFAVADAGTRVILGGVFTGVGGQPRSNVAAVLDNGRVDPAFLPQTDGKIEAVAVSADGTRVFLGGRFTTVNGVPRAGLAAVDAVTGALIESWAADTGGATPEVLSLAVSGNRLYVGGRFATIDGQAKAKLAAIDTTTGNVVAWNTWVNGGVIELTVSPDGSTVWLGGEFTRLRGLDRLYAGAVYASTGQVHPFAPTAAGGRIITVALNPDATWFYTASDNNTVFAYQPAVSNAPVWRTKMSGNAQAMAVSATELYLGGHFSQFAEQKIRRPYLASADPFTGVATTWDTAAEGLKPGVWALVIDGPFLHVGGQFTRFGTDAQRGYARFSGTP
jgi:hypothetical protein